MKTLSGKIVLVTGAARGIGAAVAQAVGAAGEKVIVNLCGQPASSRTIGQRH